MAVAPESFIAGDETAVPSDDEPPLTDECLFDCPEAVISLPVALGGGDDDSSDGSSDEFANAVAELTAADVELAVETKLFGAARLASGEFAFELAQPKTANASRGTAQRKENRFFIVSFSRVSSCKAAKFSGRHWCGLKLPSAFFPR